jgi:hypothetical protein
MDMRSRIIHVKFRYMVRCSVEEDAGRTESVPKETAGVADRALDSCLITSPLFPAVFELGNIPSDVRLNSVVKWDFP